MYEVMKLVYDRMHILQKRRETSQTCRNYYALWHIEDELDFVNGVRVLLERVDIDEALD